MEFLVVDDEEIILEAVKDFDKINPHYKIYTSSTAQEGLELFKKHNIDLVITDYKMFEMNGRELLKEIKSINPNVPVYCLTGYEILTHEDHIFLFDKVFVKPMSPIEIIQEFKKEFDSQSN